MTENASRMQQLYENAIMAAKRGSWSFKTQLYSGEIKKLIRREQLDISLSGRNSQEYNLFKAELYWKTVFNKKPMTPEQEAYIHSETDEVPATDCLAERLYLETKRTKIRDGR